VALAVDLPGEIADERGVERAEEEPLRIHVRRTDRGLKNR
jgi:hypothetical protein